MRKTSGRDKLCAFIQGMAKYYGATVETDTERHLISQAMYVSTLNTIISFKYSLTNDTKTERDR